MVTLTGVICLVGDLVCLDPAGELVLELLGVELGVADLLFFIFIFFSSSFLFNPSFSISSSSSISSSVLISRSDLSSSLRFFQALGLEAGRPGPPRGLLLLVQDKLSAIRPRGIHSSYLEFQP